MQWSSSESMLVGDWQIRHGKWALEGTVNNLLFGFSSWRRFISVRGWAMLSIVVERVF